MASATSTLGAVRPSAVEVIPASTVDGLVAGNERELQSLRRDLEEALQEAEIAEARLRDLHGGVEIDDSFEAEVMETTTRTAADVERGIDDEIRRLLAEASQQAQARAERVQATAQQAQAAERQAHAAEQPAQSMAAPAQPAPMPLQPQIVPAAPLTASAVAPTGFPEHTPAPQPIATPRLTPSAVVPPTAPPPVHATAVVPQTAPLPAAEDAGTLHADAAPAAAASVSPPAAPPVLSPQATAVQPQVVPVAPPAASMSGTSTALSGMPSPGGAHDEFWAEEREASSGGRLSKLPTNLLLQVSAVIVIMALILLKLA